jgi:cytochrome c biogenesis protein CcmG, thiol:disulfide interchange protein DsbE
MNGNRILAVLALAAGLGAVPEVAPGAAPAGGAAADDRAASLRSRSLTAGDGTTTSLAAWAGEVLVVNFWASWCAPCRAELAQLDRWNADWEGRGARVVAVSLDSDRARALRFATDHELSLTVLHDGPDGLARELDLPAVPTTYVLGRQGDIVLEVQGSDPRGLARLHDTVERLLAAGGAGSRS